MDLSYLIVFAIIGFVIWFQFGALYTAIKFQGKDVTDVLLKSALPFRDKVLLFFTSKHCAPCQTMKPIIDGLKQDYCNVHSIEVSENTELARRLDIRATPTIVIINHGVVQKVLLGSQSESKLRAFLEQ